ncbi:MAG: 1-acyl-sn-glycerol-3-phosphate acyltransferase [Prolixibacteraceae bacterium]|nr:1-acyl-sn-glycerol-3-phosphate acyltransferase [Prolixibacteraceae bacterium]
MQAYDDIRPYTDEELPQVVQTLVNDQAFGLVLQKLYPQPGAKEKILLGLQQVKNIDQLQVQFVVPLLGLIEKTTTSGLSYHAMEQFHPEENYLFISNHRDIILDAAFLNVIMHQHGFRKTEIAIGDNLLAFSWIEKLVRINRSFLVKRNLGLREQLTESKRLSSYIRYALTEKGESVWIAQREGRTKDGNDQTQPALLKMLNMSNKNSTVDGFRELNIVPMAISYEIEPCGKSKVEELLNRRYQPDFKKSQQDDLRSMANGVMMPKGRINYAFGNPLNIRLDEITRDKNYNESIQAISDFIDRRIYFNYKLWPNNYIASDLLLGEEKHRQHYTSNEKAQFKAMMENDVASIPFDPLEVTEAYLKMYANPVINFESHFA